jgi:N4-gp56 family major capsid protein
MSRKVGQIDMGGDEALDVKALLADMDVTKDITETGDIAAIIPEVWSEEIERASQPNRVMRGVVVVNTELLDGPGDIVHIPRLTNLSADPVADELTEGTGITAETWTPENALDLEPTEFGKAVTISRKAQRRAYIPVMEEITTALGEALATIEDSLIIKRAIDTASQAYIVGGHATVNGITADDVMEANVIADVRAVLKANNTPGPYYLVIHPDQERSLLDDEKFYDASRYGDREPILNGEIGRAYGVRILVSTQIPSAVNTGTITYYKALMFGNRALALALKAKPDYVEDYRPKDRETDIVSVMEIEAGVLNDERIVIVFSA